MVIIGKMVIRFQSKHFLFCFFPPGPMSCNSQVVFSPPGCVTINDLLLRLAAKQSFIWSQWKHPWYALPLLHRPHLLISIVNEVQIIFATTEVDFFFSGILYLTWVFIFLIIFLLLIVLFCSALFLFQLYSGLVPAYMFLVRKEKKKEKNVCLIWVGINSSSKK